MPIRRNWASWPSEGLNATARIILLGLAMDVIYQLLVLKTFYPNEAFIMSVKAKLLPAKGSCPSTVENLLVSKQGRRK
jgi:hypothetical protein